MQPASGEGLRRGRRRAAVVVFGVLASASLSGCFQVPLINRAPSAAPALDPLEELAAMPEVPVAELQTYGEDVAAFLTEDRNTYCAITTEQGGVIASPVDPRLSGGQRDDAVLEVPAVYCEMARYPEPADTTDDCYGTQVGFKGGTVLLTADAVSYGGCQVGMTLMEAEFGPGSASTQRTIARLPVLEEGLAIDLNGFRCGSGERGLVCAQTATGTGFVASADMFEALPVE